MLHQVADVIYLTMRVEDRDRKNKGFNKTQIKCTLLSDLQKKKKAKDQMKHLMCL